MKLDYSIITDKMQEQKDKNMVAKTAIDKQAVATSAMGLPQQAPNNNMAVTQKNDGFGRTT